MDYDYDLYAYGVELKKRVSATLLSQQKENYNCYKTIFVLGRSLACFDPAKLLQRETIETP